MLIQKPLSKKDIIEWTETKEKNNKSMSAPLIDPLSAQIDEFIQKFKKNPPKTADLSSDKVLDFLEDIRDKIDNENDVDRLDTIETYICHQLYDYLFTQPDGDEAMQDEALESRIAALNLLDLDLNHLGVSFDQEEKQFEDIAKLAGAQLQQLNTMMGAKEKLQALVKTHQIIVDAIEGFAENHRNTKTTLDSSAEVVQEMKHAMASVNEKVNADVLLPILIFTIVKSNPAYFLSNLKFIQRYRRPDQLRGQASYCLTNMVISIDRIIQMIY
jgi:gas vesicle protein